MSFPSALDLEFGAITCGGARGFAPDELERRRRRHRSRIEICQQVLWLLDQRPMTLVELSLLSGSNFSRMRNYLAGLCKKGFVQSVQINGKTAFTVSLAGKALLRSLTQALSDFNGGVK